MVRHTLQLYALSANVVFSISRLSLHTGHICSIIGGFTPAPSSIIP